MRAGVTFPQALAIIAQSTALGRCPHCRAHTMFRGWIDLYERCPHCGLRFEAESGAWIGTMAIGYAVGATIAITLTILEVLYHPLATAGFDPLLFVPLAGIAAVLPAYRPAKALWFALLYLYDFTEDAAP